MGDEERRGDLRARVRRVYATLVAPGIERVVRVENVSDAGLFVALDAPGLTRRTRVELRFPRTASTAALEVTGEIVQIVRAVPGQAAGYGVQILDAPADFVEQLRDREEDEIESPRGRGTETQDLPPLEPISDLEPDQTEVLLFMSDAGLAHSIAAILGRLHVPAAVRGSAAGFAVTLNRSTLRVVLLDLALPEVRRRALITAARVANEAIVILAYARFLPSLAERRALLAAGVEQLLLGPLEPGELAAELGAWTQRMRRRPKS